jgi:glycosyltransferase involved in cell wall biosynthesis
MNNKVLLICKKRTVEYGVSIGLVNSATFVANFLIANGIPSKVVSVIDSNSIDKEVFNYKPTHIFIQAIWVPPYKMKELVIRYPKIKWQIRVHSKIPFLANEGIAINWLSQYNNIIKQFNNLSVSGNSMAFADAMQKSMNMPVYYLPNLYFLNHNPPQRKPMENKYINIGCFGAIRPLKNHLLQAMAAIYVGNKIGKPIRFHINGGRPEQGGEQILKNLKSLFDASSPHELISHKWEEHNKFLELVASMDVGMQVSISETYNIIAADFVNVGVPIIGSQEIYLLPFFRKAWALNISSIICHLYAAYKRDNFIKRFICSQKLKADTRSAGKKWLLFLKKQ